MCLARQIYPLWAAALLLSGLLAACGSSSNDDGTGSYPGVWDLRYNLIEDGCHLVLFPIPGFIDQFTITETDLGSTLVLSAASELIVPKSVVVLENGDLFAQDSLNGDIFEDGSDCLLETEVSMAVPEDGRSATMFIQEIECNDGYYCVSRAIGSAVRQPTDLLAVER